MCTIGLCVELVIFITDIVKMKHAEVVEKMQSSSGSNGISTFVILHQSMLFCMT